MKRVIWTSNGAGHGFAYFAGDKCGLTDSTATVLQEKGLLIIIPDTVTANPPQPQKTVKVHFR